MTMATAIMGIANVKWGKGAEETRGGAIREERVYLQSTAMTGHLLGLRARPSKKIGSVHPGVAMGLVPELCSVVGVSPMNNWPGAVREQPERAKLELAALPRRIHAQKVALGDNF